MKRQAGLPMSMVLTPAQNRHWCIAQLFGRIRSLDIPNGQSLSCNFLQIFAAGSIPRLQGHASLHGQKEKRFSGGLFFVKQIPQFPTVRFDVMVQGL
nr:hypothetical protein [uncultured Cohaesibacter sp.]